MEELTQQLKSIQGNTRAELRQKDYQISELKVELAKATTQLIKRNAEFSQFKAEADELQALRETKNDMERIEKRQAAIMDW